MAKKPKARRRDGLHQHQPLRHRPAVQQLSHHELAYSTDATEDLLVWALKALERIYRPGYRYKKAGVMLNKLSPGSSESGGVI